MREGEEEQVDHLGEIAIPAPVPVAGAELAPIAVAQLTDYLRA